jgi:hypothetical protein
LEIWKLEIVWDLVLGNWDLLQFKKDETLLDAEVRARKESLVCGKLRWV